MITGRDEKSGEFDFAMEEIRWGAKDREGYFPSALFVNAKDKSKVICCHRVLEPEDWKAMETLVRRYVKAGYEFDSIFS